MLKKNKEKVKIEVKEAPGEEDSFLSSDTSKGAVWDRLRSNTDSLVEQILNFPNLISFLKSKNLANVSLSEHSLTKRLLKWRESMDQCAWLLMFDKQTLVTKEQRYKFAFSNFCRNRHCGMCNKRRQLRLIARFLGDVVPKVEENFPKGRWLMLTLTVPNVHVSQLRAELLRMSTAWRRLIQRKELRVVKGWVRSTEITFEKKRASYMHPHYHALLLVPGYYFNNYYVKHARWVELWQDAMRLDVEPSIRIKPVKTNVDGALLEVVKAFNYSIKPEELTKDPELALQYFEQVDGMRFFSSGGVLREYLKPIMDAENAELDTFSEEEEQEVASSVRKAYTWRKNVKKYKRNPRFDNHEF